MDEYAFKNHYTDLLDVQQMLQLASSVDLVRKWIDIWRKRNAAVDDSDWSDKYPSIMGVTVKDEELQIWAEKEILQDGIMFRMAIQVF